MKIVNLIKRQSRPIALYLNVVHNKLITKPDLDWLVATIIIISNRCQLINNNYMK